MASPVTQALSTTPGNLYTAATLAASANIGIFLDLSAVFEGQIAFRTTTGGTAASTSGCSITCYNVYATTTTSTTLTGGSTTTFTVGALTGFAKGQKIAIGSSTTGEIVTVSSTSGTTITLSAAPLNTYSGTTNIYFITQTAPIVGPILGQNLTSANTTYGCTLFLQTSRYFLSLINTDATNSITVEISGENITGIV